MAVLNAAKATLRLEMTLCAHACPLGWEGDSAAYMVLMRSRYTDLMHGQRMIFTPSFLFPGGGHMEVFGPCRRSSQDH